MKEDKLMIFSNRKLKQELDALRAELADVRAEVTVQKLIITAIEVRQERQEVDALFSQMERANKILNQYSTNREDITIVTCINQESLNLLLQEFQERLNKMRMVFKETEPGIVTATIEWPPSSGSPGAIPEKRKSQAEA